MTRYCIYACGPMSNANPLAFVENLRRGLVWQRLLHDAGFAVFPVFCDFLMFLAKTPDSLEFGDVMELKRQSLAWLAKADAVLMLPGWEASKGSVEEHQMAIELELPLFYDLNELKEWRKAQHSQDETLSRSDD